MNEYPQIEERNTLAYPQFAGVVLFVRHESHNIIYEKTSFTDQ